LHTQSHLQAHRQREDSAGASTGSRLSSAGTPSLGC